MIDIGGPSMLRAAAKNFAHVAPVCRPEQYEPVLDELARARELSLDTRRGSPPRRSRTPPPTKRRSRRWFARGRGRCPRPLSLSFEKVQDLAYGENPHQRAAYYRELGARAPPPLARRAAARPGALLQQPQRPLRRAAAAARVHAAGLRDRQARERVRRRGRGDDRGGVRARARLRPALGLRHGRAPSTARDRRARDAHRGAVRRRAHRAGLRRRRARRAGSEAGDADPRRPRAARLPRGRAATTSACPAGCSSRTATGTSTSATRWRVVTGSLSEAAVGRPALRVARLQARLVERDRDREGPADDRDRRGPA